MNDKFTPRLHYTTSSGLLGMFKDYTIEQPYIKIWATHYKYMNDPAEYELGIRYCKEIIDLIENERNIPKKFRVKPFVESTLYRNTFEEYCRTTAGQLYCPYIISFSKMYDSLHMWDMYASNGNGLAIVFDYKKLSEAKLLLKDCFYCPPDCPNIIQCLINQYKDDIEEIYNGQDNEIPISVVKSSMENGDRLPYYKRMHILYTIICGHIGIRIKNCAYRIEQESRITINNNGNFCLQFRERNGILLPYIEYPIPFDCVDHIIVGPTADFERVRESILIFLDYKGVRNWDTNRILQSNVPYRH